MNEPISPIEEQAIDALLAESLSSAEPPDLASSIFARLREEQVSEAPVLNTTAKGPARSGDTVVTGRMKAAMLFVAAIAASLIVATWFRSENGGNWNSTATNRPAPAPSELANRKPEPARVLPTNMVSPSSTKPRKPVPLVAESPTEISNQTNVARVDKGSQAIPKRAESLLLVSNRVNDDLTSYWNRIGVKPTEEASDAEIAGRLATVFGFEALTAMLSGDELRDPEAMRNVLSEHDVSRSIAKAWLALLTDGQAKRIDESSYSKLVDGIAACISGQESIDRVLSQWISGKHPSSASFYEAFSSGGDEHPLVRRLASLTMNVDLRCTKCHDAYIEGSGRQQDYWAFASFLDRELVQDDRIRQRQKISGTASAFYTLPDGRERMVEPAIPPRWNSSEINPNNLTEWSQQLIGSSSLARGVVNSLWNLVHGQPLNGSMVDPISAPKGESLQRLLDDLSDDLLRSGFRIDRTLSLIATSEASRRQVPRSLQDLWVRKDNQTREATSAFAAATPPRTRLSIQEKFDQTIRAFGGKVEIGIDQTLAQIGEGTQRPVRRPKDANSLAWDFPDAADSAPVQWLSRIGDEQEQVKHLAYLAGHASVPKTIWRADEAMHKAEINDDTRLHRVWWMLK